MKYLLLLFMLNTSPVFTIESDKVAHFAVGYVVGDVAYEVGRTLGLSPVPALLLSLGAAGIAGYIKEKRDEHFDNADLAATVIGGAFSCGTRLVFRFK